MKSNDVSYVKWCTSTDTNHPNTYDCTCFNQHIDIDHDTTNKWNLFVFIENWIKITKKIHVLLKWNQNNKKKKWYIKEKFVVFYYKVFTYIIALPKTMCLIMNSFSQKLPSLGNPKSHHPDSKPTRVQNSNLQCSMINPCPKCLVHPNHVIILPP